MLKWWKQLSSARIAQALIQGAREIGKCSQALMQNLSEYGRIFFA